MKGNKKWPKIALIGCIIAAVCLVIDGFLAHQNVCFIMAGVFIVIGLLYSLDMHKDE